MTRAKPRRALVAGWFSFDWMGASAGDLMARDVVTGWLDQAGIAFDVAMTAHLGGGVLVDQVDPADYSDLIFVCGPLGNGEPVTSLLERFGHANLVSINNSMLQDLDEWNPFDLLIERDSSRASRPDIALLAENELVPVAGLILVHKQKEYAQGRYDHVHSLLRAFLDEQPAAIVQIDTCLDPENQTGLRSPREIEALIAKMDVVLTTRLHGLVLSLKNGVPAIAVDPIAGGAKIVKQAAALGWPYVFSPETLSKEALSRAYDDCMSGKGRQLAQCCAAEARRQLDQSKATFLNFVESGERGCQENADSSPLALTCPPLVPRS